MGKSAPQLTPETKHFWEGTRDGKLLLQTCSDCRHTYFPPRPFCPQCHSKDIKIRAASGKATVYSFVINHFPRQDWPQRPHSIAIVQLEEGPKMISNIVGVAASPEAIRLDMPVQVDFEKIDGDMFLPVFLPA